MVAAGCSSDTSKPTATASGSSAQSTAARAPATAAAASSGSPTTVTGFDPNAPEVNGAGDIPDNQVFVPFRFAAGPYTVSVPEGWGRTDSGGVTVFTDNFNSVQLQVVAATSAPSVDSARRDEVPMLQASTTNFQLGAVSTTTRKGGDAVLVTYTADSAPNPVTGKVLSLAAERYEFWHDGQEAVVTLFGPVGADNVDPWRTVTDSFVWG
jgi:hypothetical protein